MSRQLIDLIVQNRGNTPLLVAELDRYNRGLATGDIKPNVFVEEGGLDALDSISSTADETLALKIFNTAFNTTHRRLPYEAALRRRPNLFALYERYYAKFGNVLDAKPLEGGLPTNASPYEIVAAIRTPGRNARQLGSDVYMLKKAIERGETGAVLAAGGDIAVMDSERDPKHQGPEYGNLHSNIFFFLSALRTSIELGDGRFETNMDAELRAAANRVLASGGANVTAKTGLLYAPSPMSFTGLGDGFFSCFGSTPAAPQPVPAARDRGLGDMLMGGMMGGPGYGMGGMGGYGQPMMGGGYGMGGYGQPMMGGYGQPMMGGYGRPGGMGMAGECCPMLACACCAYLCCQALD